jgi:hypothetical protein
MNPTSTDNINLQLLITGEKNPRGIPGTKFIVRITTKLRLISNVLFELLFFKDNVDGFLTQGFSVEAALGAFNELYSKYKYMETSFEKSKGIYKSKIPDIEQTLELVKLMVAKNDENEEMITNYGLSDTLYSKAKVSRYYIYSGRVCLISLHFGFLDRSLSRSCLFMDWCWYYGGIFFHRSIGIT